MAGIYIPGMEMPENCEKCPLLDYEEGFCLASGVKGKSGWYESVLCPGSIKDGRHEDCPLTPVPDHGRLGDLDAMAERARQAAAKAEKEQFYDGELWYPVIAKWAEIEPTIIPADKKEG